MRNDADALKRAFAIASRTRGAQLESMLADNSRRQVSEFAAAFCQREALALKPWEAPPCSAIHGFPGDAPAIAMLERMLAAGLSRFEPDPLQALKRRRRR